MECLFVGGSHDGDRMRVPDGERRVRLPILNKSVAGVFDYEDYVFMRLAGDSKEFVVFVLDGMNGNYLIEQLIASYNPQPDR